MTIAGLLVFVPAAPALTQQSQPPTAQRVVAETLRAAALPDDIQIDGRLDEPEWLAAPKIENLTMIDPTEGVAPTLPTVVRVLAGKRAIVVGVECEDDRPSSIVSYSKARDSQLEHEDHVRILLDTFRDGRSGYVFAINPSGARYDALVARGGEGENSNWDEIWEAATVITARGWSAEIRIPVRSLRFAGGLRSWGFNVERRIERLQEVTRWSGPRRDWKLTQSSHAGLLQGLPEFEAGIGLSVRPALVAGTGKQALESAAASEADVSLDVTQLLGPALLGSLTVNTDFAETEVDTRRTNLTRFPLFFPEKRTFFLQGADVFDFGPGGGNDVVPFHSRRIGLVEGREVPLTVGGKINGRLHGTNLGALVVHAGELEDVVGSADMAVVRARQDVLAESSIGVIATAGDPQGRRGAWLAGGDFTYQTSRLKGDKNFLVGVWGLALDRDDLVKGDKTAYGARIDYPNDTWDISLTYQHIGEAFDPSLGFVPRRGVQILTPNLEYTHRPAWPWLRAMYHELQTRLVGDLDGNWETYRVFMAPVNWRLESGDRFEFNVVPEGEQLDEPFEIADGIVIPPGAYHWLRYRLEGGLAPKRPFSGTVAWWFGGFYDGRLDQYEATLNWNPSATLNIELTGERNVGDLPFGSFTQDLFGTRVAVNFSPDLQLSSFVQYDSESDSIGSNTRLRWTFRPLGDLFVIYNYNIVDILDRWAADTNQLKFKLEYTVRK